MNKDGIFHFLGACVIAAAILAAGAMIAYKMPQTPTFPSSLSVATSDSTREFGDYLSPYDAAAYLGLNLEDFLPLIDSGELDSAICKVGEDCIISKQALQEWVDSRIGN